MRSKEGDKLRKSYNLPICAALFIVFSALSTGLYFLITGSSNHGIVFMICVALLLSTQNLIHVFVGRSAPLHPLRWQISVVFACDAVWCALFLFRYMADLVPNQIKQGLLLHFIGFSLVHLAVLAKYLLTAHLLSQKAASAEYVQSTEQFEGR